MKLIILGSNGMLGTYLKYHLGANNEIITLTRNDIDLSSNHVDVMKYLLCKVKKGDVIINAAGITKHREYVAKDMIFVNGILPHLLNEIKQQVDCQVIHITTDCVYSGLSGNYHENDPHDAIDDYGKSKSLGENELNTNIRTSIIGEDKRNNRSLVEWVRSNANKEINGFHNHLWNGVTCLQLSKFIESMIKKGQFWNGTRHIYSPNIVSKYELVHMINKIYDLRIKINSLETKNHCYRTLTSIYDDTLSINKDIMCQIIEQKEFGEKM